MTITMAPLLQANAGVVEGEENKVVLAYFYVFTILLASNPFCLATIFQLFPNTPYFPNFDLFLFPIPSLFHFCLCFRVSLPMTVQEEDEERRVAPGGTGRINRGRVIMTRGMGVYCSFSPSTSSLLCSALASRNSGNFNRGRVIMTRRMGVYCSFSPSTSGLLWPVETLGVYYPGSPKDPRTKSSTLLDYTPGSSCCALTLCSSLIFSRCGFLLLLHHLVIFFFNRYMTQLSLFILRLSFMLYDTFIHLHPVSSIRVLFHFSSLLFSYHTYY